MTCDQVLSHYEAVRELTIRMLKAAQLRDWESMVELELRCRSHITELSSSEAEVALPPGSRVRKVEIIHQILAHDRQIRDLTTPWMADLAALINSNGTSRKLNAAYGA